MGKKCTGVADDALQILMNHEWKGNIRELQNVIERAIIFAEGDQIKISDIGLVGPAAIPLDRGSENLNLALKNYEREHIFRVLDKYDGNKAKAARVLGVGLSSLYRKICELQIDADKPGKK
jgi:DNA-binding NtrC family response regulator